MELKETIKAMENKNYIKRFKTEYFQLKFRIIKLKSMLKKYKLGTLNFKPFCSYDLLNGQLKAMNMYASCLQERAKIEKIEIEKIEL